MLVFAILISGFVMYPSTPSDHHRPFRLRGQPHEIRGEDGVPHHTPIIRPRPGHNTHCGEIKIRPPQQSPYLINLPAFFTAPSRLKKKEGSIWLNRYFESMLEPGIFFGVYFLLLLFLLFDATASGNPPVRSTALIIGFPMAGLPLAHAPPPKIEPGIDEEGQGSIPE